MQFGVPLVNMVSYDGAREGMVYVCFLDRARSALERTPALPPLPCEPDAVAFRVKTGDALLDVRVWSRLVAEHYL